MSLLNVKELLQVDNTRVDLIYELVSKQLISKLNIYTKDIVEPYQEVPTELEYIVDELTIIRYNKLGSEGMSSESVEGHSATYEKDPFKGYLDDIMQYVEGLTPISEGVIRFI